MYCVIKISVFFNPLCVLMTCRKELFTSTVRCGLCVQERESVPQMWTVCKSLPQMWTVCTREGITSTDVDCVYKRGNHFHSHMYTVCTREGISSINRCGLGAGREESTGTSMKTGDCTVDCTGEEAGGGDVKKKKKNSSREKRRQRRTT